VPDFAGIYLSMASQKEIKDFLDRKRSLRIQRQAELGAWLEQVAVMQEALGRKLEEKELSEALIQYNKVNPPVIYDIIPNE
jgi:hypothetical protein